MAFRISLSACSSSTFFIACCCLLLRSVRSDDTQTQLLQGINSYRASLNLSSLTENKNAKCLAEQLAEQFKGQECSNTTGADTVPGTEQQFSNFPDFLSHCNLNATVTQDGQIMPACVPALDSSMVLTNYTESQYNEYLNGTSFVGIGMADEGNWVVVVLTTNTTTGSFATADTASLGAIVAPHGYSLLLLLSLFVMLFS